MKANGKYVREGNARINATVCLPIRGPITDQ